MQRMQTNFMVRKHILLSRIEPSVEKWESIGFKFNDIDDKFIEVILPDGWFFKKVSGDIVDLNVNIRGTILLKGRHLEMSLACKYKAGFDYLNSNQTKREYYFGNKNEKIFVAGTVTRLEREKSDINLRQTLYMLQNEYQNIVEAFANEYYPDYKNPLAYWDDEKEKVYKK